MAGKLKAFQNRDAKRRGRQAIVCGGYQEGVPCRPQGIVRKRISGKEAMALFTSSRRLSPRDRYAHVRQSECMNDL